MREMHKPEREMRGAGRERRESNNLVAKSEVLGAQRDAQTTRGSSRQRPRRRPRRRRLNVIVLRHWVLP